MGHRIGWIGLGNMGMPLVTRLLRADCEVAIYNRTKAKAKPLTDLGATVVDSPGELSGCDIVFSVVAGPADFTEVMLGDRGVLSDPRGAPRILVDCSTISTEASAAVREVAQRRGSVLVAAPISGNGRHVAAGGALFAVSGPADAVETIRPYFEILGRGMHHLGQADDARLVKIAHNLFLAAIIQSLVETTLLVEAAGISRREYLDFINDSPLGSTFTGYKTPALVDLDWTPTFTTALLRKDLDLGLSAASDLGVQLPVAATVREQVQAAIDAGHVDEDFAVLLAAQAKELGVELASSTAETADRRTNGR